MIIETEAKGPLFSGRINLIAAQRLALDRATGQAMNIARAYLRQRTRYSTARYGHAVDSVRSRIQKSESMPDQQVGRVFIGGQAAFLAPWLEFGVKQHPIPDEGARGTGNRRRFWRRAVTMPIPAGGGIIFRASLPRHRGARAFHWASLTQAQVNQEAPKIFDQAYRDSITGAG